MRKRLSSRARRSLRWEFWPMWLFYVPVVLYIAILSIRYRGLTFLSSNPGIPMSGLVGEKKAATLLQLRHNEALAKFCQLPISDHVDQRIAKSKAFIEKHNMTYPLVLKPDLGQRGSGVIIVRDEASGLQNISQAKQTLLLQEYIPGLEFGVFYYRLPSQKTGRIFSITEKRFPIVVGDGQRTLEMLMLEDNRLHYMADFLLVLHADKLDWVVPAQEKFTVVEIGSHCRGSLFLEGGQYITTALTKKIDQISHEISGFYFGRYDIRVDTLASLQRGENIKVIEVNGVTSESTNVYDPKYSVFHAYKVFFKQWKIAFAIGLENIDLGSERVGFVRFIQYVYKYFKKC